MQRTDPPLARAGRTIADFTERYFPDAFIFALAAVIITFILGLAIGEPAAKLVTAFGGGFWSLANFTIQMSIIIIGGFVVATAPPCAAVIERIATIPKTPRGAIAFVSMFSMLTSLISWGLSLIVTGLLVRAIVRRIDDVDFRAIGAAAYLGLGSVWALGLSSSSAMMMASESAIPAALKKITGVIPLRETIFLGPSILLAAILITVATLVAYWSAPSGENARTAKQMGVVFEPAVVTLEPAVTPAEKVENNPLVSLVVVVLMFTYLGMQIVAKGWGGAIDLNNFNLAFIGFGLLLHWRPKSFLRAVSSSVPATAGVLIQFPFYAGVAGLISQTRIHETLSNALVSIANPTTFNPIVAMYSALLDLFIPSGGGKWVIEAPYVMQAAKDLGMHLGWTIQTYNAAETVSNLLNPFFMLPLMGILNVKARDLAGYSILQFLFHAPIVIVYCWIVALMLR